MTNALLAYDNYVAGATSVAMTPGAVAGFPVTRLYDYDSGARARFPGVCGIISVDLGSARAVDFVAAIQHNAPSGVSIKVSGNTTSDFTSPAYGPTALAGTPHAYLKLASAATYRYWQLDVGWFPTLPTLDHGGWCGDDGGTALTDTTFRVGEIFIGACVELGENMAPGYSWGESYNQVQQATAYGVARTYTVATKVGAFTINWENIGVATRNQLNDLFNKTLGGERPFVFVPDPDTEAKAHYVRVSGGVSWQSVHPLWETYGNQSVNLLELRGPIDAIIS